MIRAFLRVVFVGFLAVGPANASTVELIPTSYVNLHEGNVSGLFSGQGAGIVFNLDDPGASLHLDSASVFAGRPGTSPVNMSASLYWRDGSNWAHIQTKYRDLDPVVDWQEFDFDDVMLPYSYSGSGRSLYALIFHTNDYQGLQGREYTASNSSSTATWFWDQDGLEFIYGMRSFQVVPYAPAIRLGLVSDQDPDPDPNPAPGPTPSPVPLPASAWMLISAFGGLFGWRRWSSAA